MDVPDKQETPESSGGDEEAGQNEETGQVSLSLSTGCYLMQAKT